MNKLKFYIKNLGSVDSGEFEHKPLTIFCGPNNSGKTWAMYFLYHFYTFIGEKDISSSLDLECIQKLSENDFSNIDFIDFIKNNKQEIIAAFNKELLDALPNFF